MQRAEVLCVEPSHFDAAEAYAVLGLYRLGDYTPYVFRTRDSGKSWTRIAEVLATNQPSGSFARVVRNDPLRRGLLFAGSTEGSFMAFNARTGKVVWYFNSGQPISASPMTYSFNGKQYVAIAAGSDVMAFRLFEKSQ